MPPVTAPIRKSGACCLSAVLGVLVVFVWTHVAQADDADGVTFLGVALEEETREADRRLQRYLELAASLEIDSNELEYGRVIELLAGWDPADGVVIARTTPYVQVVSEMLGAELEVLATYESMATGRTTYHAYYVVRRDAVPPNPTPADVIAFISAAPAPVHFTYHNLFSTSSYFLPSLHFRANDVFHMSESTESLAAIDVSRTDTSSSSHLVKAVARGDAGLAAVWDGTRARFTGLKATPADAAVARDVAFVRLPSPLPNDLLVCSRSAPADLKQRIRDAIQAMPPKKIDIGDFAHWVDIRAAVTARAALAQLRWLAREQVPPVTVDVRPGQGSEAGTAMMVNAARHAVRLSGTEFVLYDKDFHQHLDVVWTLDEIHDGAARLTTSLPDTGIEDQVFPISYRDAHDLTGRIVAIAQARLHRIRYVWPYSQKRSILLRDTTLPMPVGRTVPVERITWLDPERNSFRAGDIFEADVTGSSLFVHELHAEEFPTEFDPMSNVSYRVYLLRTQPSNVWFRVATGALVGLLALAAIAAALALRRGPRREQPTPDMETR